MNSGERDDEEAVDALVVARRDLEPEEPALDQVIREQVERGGGSTRRHHG
ncbi:MAG: hypothetical protein ACTHU0_03865 [Kofleriaceae bacterium]